MLIKKVISLLCASVILFNTAGYFVYHSLYRQSLQYEVKQQLKYSVPEADLIRIVPETDDQLVWVKPAKEFRYNGQMYDVVKTERVKGRKVYLCIHDFKESKLFAKLDHHVQSYLANSPSHKKRNQRAFKQLNLHYCQTNTTALVLHVPFDTIRYTERPVQLHGVQLNTLKPPPKHVS